MSQYVLVVKDIYSGTVHAAECSFVQRAKRVRKFKEGFDLDALRKQSMPKVGNLWVRVCDSCLGEKKKSVKFTASAARKLWRQACEAGRAAGEAINAEKFVAVERVNPLDDSSAIKKIYPEPFEACGFGYITVRPGNSSFARWMVKNGFGYRAYEGGIQHSVRDFGQSYERKVAYANAAAMVLREAGVNAYGGGRLD